ncbi:MAG: hypothetical protein ACOYL7_12635 [Caldilinea sp.]
MIDNASDNTSLIAPDPATAVAAAQNMLAVVIPYLTGPERVDAVKDWRLASATAEILAFTEKPFDLQAVRKALDTVLDSGSRPLPLRAALAVFLTGRLMTSAENRGDLILADIACSAAQRANLPSVAELSQRKDDLNIKLTTEVDEAHAAFLRRITALQQQGTPAALQDAIRLVQAQIVNTEAADGWQRKLADTLKTLELANAVAELAQQKDNLVDRLHRATEVRNLEELEREFKDLRDRAGNKDAPPGATAVATACSIYAEKAKNSVAAIMTVNKHIEIAQAALQRYDEIQQKPAYVGSEALDREYKVGLLTDARKELNEANALALNYDKVQTLQKRVDSAWRAEQGDATPYAPTNPVKAELTRLTAEANKLIQQTDQQFSNLAEKQSVLTKDVSNLQKTVETVGKQLRQLQDVIARDKRIALALLLGVLAVALVGVGWTWWQGQQQTAVHEARVRQAGTELEASVTSRLNGLLTSLQPLPVAVAALSADVAALGTAVADLGTSMVTSDSVAMQQAITDGVAIEKARADAAVAAAATIATQLAATQTAIAAIALRQSNISIELANAVATAVAATVTALPAPAPAVTPEPAVTETEPDAAAQVTATQIVTSSTVTIIFPTDGAQLYTAPWQIAVTGRPWPVDFTTFRLRLNDAAFDPFSPPGQETFTINRSIDGSMDGNIDTWPTLSDTEVAKLSSLGRVLQPGAYTLQVEGLAADGATTELARSSFTIVVEPPLAQVNPQRGIERRIAPDLANTTIAQGGALPQNTSVKLLGKTTGPDDSNADNLVPWCFWESVDGNVRRGWTLCKYLSHDNQPADQRADAIPNLAPPPPQLPLQPESLKQSLPATLLLHVGLELLPLPGKNALPRSRTTADHTLPATSAWLRIRQPATCSSPHPSMSMTVLKVACEFLG